MILRSGCGSTWYGEEVKSSIDAYGGSRLSHARSGVAMKILRSNISERRDLGLGSIARLQN